MRILTILFLILGVWVSAYSADKDAEAMLAKWAYIGRFTVEGPLFLKKQETLESIRKLGPLKSQKITQQPDPYRPAQLEEYHTLQFDGLEIYGRVEINRRDFRPVRVTVYAPEWKILHGLGVGTPSQRIEEILGQPNDRGPGLLKYNGEVDQVHFHVRNGAITKVVFIYFSG
jgi:hypothetical protein